MWNSLVGILKTLSPRQRFLALTLLLLTSIVITLTPDILRALYPDDPTLKAELRRRDERIQTLSRTNDTLFNRLSTERMECNRDLYRQTEEFRRRLLEIEALLQRPTLHTEAFGMIRDTIPVAAVPLPALQSVQTLIRDLSRRKPK